MRARSAKVTVAANPRADPRDQGVVETIPRGRGAETKRLCAAREGGKREGIQFVVEGARSGAVVRWPANNSLQRTESSAHASALGR
jgi:hypothetical protein